jgi:hypothetical protein
MAAASVRPEGVADGAAAREFGMAEQEAHAVAAGGAGVGLQVGQLRLDLSGGHMQRAETGPAGLDPQMRQQRTVVHPVKNALLGGLQEGRLARGQHEQITCGPWQLKVGDDPRGGTFQPPWAARAGLVAGPAQPS